VLALNGFLIWQVVAGS